jgi:type II secretory ATPase GspE/PulE/Tfp pilus assembly ATPase PilB-like protein
MSNTKAKGTKKEKGKGQLASNSIPDDDLNLALEQDDIVIEKATPDEETTSKLSRRQLGKLLVEQELITADELKEALDLQKEKGGRLGEILVEKGLIDYEVLLDVLSMQLNVPVIDVKGVKISREAQELIPEAMARDRSIVPLEVVEGRLLVAMAYPDDIGTINDIKAMTTMRVEVGLCSPKDIEQAINLNYRSSVELEHELDKLESMEEKPSDRTSDNIINTPAAQSLTMIIKQAVQDRASDIHLEPQEDMLRVRYRIDGMLHDIYSLPLAAHLPLMSRLKILGGMNIAEQRRPQDGQFSIKIGGKDLDIRVASLGSLHGERATLRILDKSLPLLTLEELGFLSHSMEKVQNILKSAYGMILIGGPTGSGKTTTLYAMINHLRNDERNIMTIEDPIEYRFTGITQIQTNAIAGITFSSGLRAIVRQDPDVILIGEIRDQETAKIAVQAALTGHLVLASIHANDVVNVLFRLIDLGIDQYLITSTLVGMVAQRMIRRVCPYCHVATQPSEQEKIAYQEYIKEELPELYTGKGCTVCANTGYFGRTGAFEILQMNDEIRSKLSRGFSAADIKEAALQQGMVTLGHDGMIKAKEGITSIMEVLRCMYTIS